MKTIGKLITLLLMALLIFVPLGSAAAKGLMDGEVVFGRSYTLTSGKTLQGDLVVIGGTATVEASAVINGALILIGGNLVLDGEVNGEVAIVGGNISLGADSHITGDLTTVGATLIRSEGSQVDGQINNAATSWMENGNSNAAPQVLDNNPPQSDPNITINFQPLASFLETIGQGIGLAVLAMLVVMFLAPQAGRVAQAVTVQPMVAGGLGLLTIIMAPITIVLLSITIILIPVAMIVVILLGMAGIFGWIALGYEIGMRLTRAIHWDWHPAFAAGLGTLALSLVTAALTGIPVVNWFGWLAPFLLSIASLGAVIMTRFGAQTVTAPASKEVVIPSDLS